MQKIELTVNKTIVWTEAAKIAGYTGYKLADEDAGAYDRLMLTDADQESLQRFWEEAAAGANTALRELLDPSATPVTTLDGDYCAKLWMSRSYDTALTGSIEASLRGYFIASIVGRWYKLSHKAEAESYFMEAAAALDDALRKLYSRKRPTRLFKNPWFVIEEAVLPPRVTE